MTSLSAADYDAWYATPRGGWIGDTEFHLMRRMLRAEPGERLLDLGCGTGYFSRRFAQAGQIVTGIDPNREWLSYARGRAGANETYLDGRMEALPFADGSFDRVISVAALCFVADQRQAIRELLRVTRRRFAIGVLNRHSLLYLQKGRGGGSVGNCGYRGAHWHTAGELKTLFDGLPVSDFSIASAVFLPAGGAWSRLVERSLPDRLPLGAFLVAAGSVAA